MFWLLSHWCHQSKVNRLESTWQVLCLCWRLSTALVPRPEFSLLTFQRVNRGHNRNFSLCLWGAKNYLFMLRCLYLHLEKYSAVCWIISARQNILRKIESADFCMYAMMMMICMTIGCAGMMMMMTILITKGARALYCTWLVNEVYLALSWTCSCRVAPTSHVV